MDRQIDQDEGDYTRLDESIDKRLIGRSAFSNCGVELGSSVIVRGAIVSTPCKQ